MVANANQDNNTLTKYLIALDNPALLELFINKGLDIHQGWDINDNRTASALHYAAVMLCYQQVEYLLKTASKAQINFQSEQGYTAVMTMIQDSIKESFGSYYLDIFKENKEKLFKIIKLFGEKEVNFNLPNKAMQTPLLLATSLSHNSSLLSKLLHYINVNEMEKDFQKLLNNTVSANNPKSLFILLEKGAIITLHETSSFENPFDIIFKKFDRYYSYNIGYKNDLSLCLFYLFQYDQLPLYQIKGLSSSEIAILSQNHQIPIQLIQLKNAYNKFSQALLRVIKSEKIILDFS